MRRILALFVSLAAVAMVRPAPGGAANRGPFAAMPALTLWAWERPEDLRALPDNVAVAFLAQTITLRDPGVQTDPRRQPLRVRPDTPLIAVTRIEAPPGRAALDSTTLNDIARSIALTGTLPQVDGVQIDFDATASQRAIYRNLLHRVRAEIGPAMRLSITALASWCMDDSWLEDLPIDEAVPMLFRMGPDWPPARRAEAAERLRRNGCTSALGLSLDEPLDVRSRGRRVYIFNPRPWNTSSIAAARRISP